MLRHGVYGKRGRGMQSRLLQVCIAAARNFFLQDLRFSVEEMRGVFIESSRQGRIFSVSFEETQ